MSRLSYPVVLALLACSEVARAVPAGFTIDDVATISGDPQVTSMAWAPDGSNRLFITGKRGEVWILEDGAILPQTFIRLVPRASSPSGELVTSSECGLLAVAFDPDFVRNGHVYFFATLHPTPGSDAIEQQILRFTATGNAGSDRRVIVRGLASLGFNHDGGALAFGPDGLIYWAVGDNGNGTGQGNDTRSSAAKVGRAPAVPDAPPVAGPFNDGPGPNFDYIFARGFRNPYTMTFEPASGNLWVNVVGTSWEQIFVVSEGSNAGWPGENLDLGAAGTHTIEPVLVYPTGSGSPRSVGAGGAVRAGGTLTFTTGQDHQLRAGNNVVVSGIDDASMNGTFTIAQVTGARSLRVANPGPDASSGNGSLTHEDYGRVILGGTFYDASQFPEAYRGDFFFGDYVNGELVHAVVNGAGDGVVSVDRFHTGLGGYIDAATGPDGALYLVRHGGAISRITADVTAQGIVVSPLHLQIVEGGRGVVMVSLAQQPGAPVTLDVARMAGDEDLGVMSGASLTFTTGNWDVPQAVTLSSIADADGSADVATFAVSGSGAGSQSFRVRATEPIATTTPPQDAGVADASPFDARVIDAPAVRDAAVDGDGGPMTPGEGDDGCGCRAGGDASSPALAALALAALLVLRRRR
jgi:MYXO-CTERM domain-containing protein